MVFAKVCYRSALFRVSLIAVMIQGNNSGIRNRAYEHNANVILGMDEGRKRVIGIMATILTSTCKPQTNCSGLPGITHGQIDC